MKTAAATLSVAAVVVVCSCIRANDSAYHHLGPIEDPSTLPFKFNIDRGMPVFASDGSPTTGRFVRTTSCGGDELQQYAIINNWKFADTSSAIVFYADLAFADALEHVNIKTREIFSDRFGDFDGDGHCEVAITYAHNDSLWLDVVSYRSGLSSHLLLLEGVDRDGNGYWDGRASILASEDLNGDGCDELLLATDVGYDLYPRELICVDVTNQDILWRFAHSGIVADRNFHIVRSDTSAPLLVVGIGSKGNAVVAGDMDDQHSYLLVLNTDGNLLWKRELGRAFSRATPVVLDYQSDGTLEIVVPWRSYSDDMRRDRTILGVFSTTGDLLDSLVLDSSVGVRSLSTFDIDDDGSLELVVSLTNKQTVVINSSLQIEKVCVCNSFLDIWAVADFCGTGRNQLLAVSESNMVWLLDTDLEPLAQLYVAEKPFRRSTALNSAGVIVGTRGFVLAADNGKVHYFITISKAHWSAVFQRNHWLIVLCAAAPLCLIIALLVYAWYCTKKHARVVQEQRDHLSKALEDLRATEHKLGVVETSHKALERIADAERLQKALLNAVTESLILFDHNMNIVALNDTAAKRIGMTVDDLVGKNASELTKSVWTEEEFSERQRIFKEVLTSGKPTVTQGVRGEFIFDSHYSPISNGQGQVTGIAVFACDVTQQQRFVAALRESEESLKRAQTAAKIGSWDWLILEDKVIWSDETYRQFGFEPGQITPSFQTFERFVHPGDRQAMNQAIKEALEENRPYSLDARMVRMDGTSWIMHAHGTVYRHDDGTPFRFVGTMQDITEHKRILEKLEFSEKTSRALLNATTDAAILIDRDGRVVTANEAMAERFDTTTEDLAGQIIFDFMPEDLARVRRSNIRKMIQSPAPTIVVDESDGRILRNSSVPILDDNGHLVQVAVFSQDITDERRAQAELSANEERYRTLVESSPYGIAVIDTATGKYRFVNPEFSKQLGYSFEEMVQKRVGDLSLEDSKHKTQSMYPAFQGNERNIVAGIPLVHKDGTIRHFDIRTVPTVYEGRESLVAMMRDVSEEMESQRKVHEQAGLLERLTSRLIDIQEDDRKHIARELHDGIAQELSVAKIKLETAIMDAMPPQKKTLQDASQTLAKALGELRGITTELRPPILDRLGFVATVEWYVSSHCGDIEPILKVDGNPDGLTESRQLNLFRILQEIINNARKHSGATRIEIELRFLENETELLVRDNGCGFDLIRVKRNWQRDTSFGILNITERVELLGGHVDITTGKDMGTTFQISIPNK